MADFDPRQLDVLEDALEGLEDIDDLESLELSPALTERLAEYQDVLALCRDAFPVEEPRADLLADVIAEAQAVSRRPKLREPDTSRWRRSWDRWRGTVIPTLALAATAAAVLLVLEPGREIGRSEELLANDQRADEDPTPSEDTDTTPSEPASEPSIDEDEGGEANDDAGPEPDEAGDARTEQPQQEPSEPSPTAGASKPKSRPRKAPEPAVAPAPAPEPMSKDETWTALERADTNRRKGDCDKARSRYQHVIAAGTDSLAIARAKAGIGLCLEQDRRTTEANKWFSLARSDNAGIDAWIENQRDEQPLPGEAKKSKTKRTLPAEADAL